MQLADEARCNVLKEPLTEIERLLEGNLLDKFKRMRERMHQETGAPIHKPFPARGSIEYEMLVASVV